MQPCSQPRYGFTDCENGRSGEVLRLMIVRAGSMRTVVCGRRGGSGSSPSSTSGTSASAVVAR